MKQEAEERNARRNMMKPVGDTMEDVMGLATPFLRQLVRTLARRFIIKILH